MPTYTILCRVDAYVDYTTEVEADDPGDAVEMARESPEDYEWQELGPCEFDARGYVALDAEGNEIEATRAGRF